jgi:hypothetical protein
MIHFGNSNLSINWDITRQSIIMEWTGLFTARIFEKQ